MCYIGGLQKSGKSTRSSHTFWQRPVTVDFDDISLVKYGQLILNHCHVHYWMCYRGCAEKWQIHVYAVVTLFDSDRFLWILMIYHYQSIVSWLYNHCHVDTWMWYKESDIILEQPHIAIGFLLSLLAYYSYYLHSTVYMLECTHVFCTRSKSCFGGLIEQSGYLVYVQVL